MKILSRIVLAALSLGAVAPAARAACADEIAALERRVKEQATAAISTSTGGKEVAAAREGQAVEARDKDVPVTAVPRAPASGTAEAQATQKAEQAGAGGDRVMQAKATLNRARTLDGHGDGAGCSAAVAEAKRQLGA